MMLAADDSGAGDVVDQPERIAIIGMEGRFPGAPTLRDFWHNLREGIESTTRFTDDDLRGRGVPEELLDDPRYVKSGTVLDGIDLFDASFFGMSPAEAATTDPQQRLFLESAWSALEGSGYDPFSYSGSIGLFAGSGINNYVKRFWHIADESDPVGAYRRMIGNNPDYLATRVSYLLNLRGPSLTVQTACSTSLVAVHLASQSLLTYQCDMALAGGVNLLLPQGVGYIAEEGMIMSPDGHCRAFDAGGRGIFAGRGLGVVVLKRLSEAIDDGDNIRAVISGSAINNDGFDKVGFTAPSIDGQAEVITTALAFAGVHPGTIQYVEAHGTGTPLGDPIEVRALTTAYRAQTSKTGYCALGSVKTNVGHLDAAAGVTGLIKTVLALEHKEMPPSLNFSEPNPEIDFDSTPFFVNDSLRPWPEQAVPRRAAVSSFGIGGTNAHVILEEAPPTVKLPSDDSLQLLVLSARTAEAGNQAARNLAAHLGDDATDRLADVAYTLQVGRARFAHRSAVAAANRADAVAALRGGGSGKLITGSAEPEVREVAFLFTGQGSQYGGMGRGLYETYPVFRDHIDDCAATLTGPLGRDVRDLMFSDNPLAAEQLRQTANTQPALFAVSYALARLWESWGVQPSALLGHSIGEYVAACLSGVFTLQDALEIVAERGRLIQELPPGSMLAVPLPEAELTARMFGTLSVAVVNAPAACVVAGSTDDIATLEGMLAAEGSEGRRLRTSHAFHSVMMEPAVEPFAHFLSTRRLHPPRLPFLSNVTGTWISPESATDPGYWATHIRSTVRFADCLGELATDPQRALLEVGPGNTLATLASRTPGGRDRVVATSLRHPLEDTDDATHILTSLGRLWVNGYEPDWRSLHQSARVRVPLPTYPFERVRHWADEGPGQPSTALTPEPDHSPISHSVDDASGVQLDDGSMLDDRQPDPPVAPGGRTPGTETELLLVGIWQELLGIQAIGLDDNYFDLGGDSLLGMSVVARSNKAGVPITPQHLLDHPTIGELAAIVGDASDAESESVTGDDVLSDEHRPVPLMANQARFLIERQSPQPERWNISWLLAVRGRIDLEKLQAAVNQLISHHEALRLRFRAEGSSWVQSVVEAEELKIPSHDLGGLDEADQLNAMQDIQDQLQTEFDLARGPLFRAAHFDLGASGERIYVVIHHLVADRWSLAVLLEDLETAYDQLVRGTEIELPAATSSYRQWAESMDKSAQSAEISADVAHWLSLPWSGLRPLPLDRAATPADNTNDSAETVVWELPAGETARLIALGASSPYSTEELLAATLAWTLAETSGHEVVGFDRLGHGRASFVPGIDLRRTVGFFLSYTPVVVRVPSRTAAAGQLGELITQIRRSTRKPLSFDALRWLSRDAGQHLQALPRIDVSFNYSADSDLELLRNDALFETAAELGHSAPNHSPKGLRYYPLAFLLELAEDRLKLALVYSNVLHERVTVETVVDTFFDVLRSVIEEASAGV